MNITLKKPLVYVARDIERALGMAPEGLYFVVSNDTSYGRKVKERYGDNVLLIKSDRMLDTHELLEHPEARGFIVEKGADIAVFQSSPRIERIAAQQGWDLLNPPAALSREVEEKVSQVRWLSDDAELLPPHRITLAKDVGFEGAPLVLQWNHSHTGEGTYVIASDEGLRAATERFPERECRVTRFVEGPVFTVNAVVGDAIVVGNPSYQITGLAPFTDLPFSTVGNDWELPLASEYAAVYEDIRKIALRVGERLKASGWYGLFGIDAIYDEKASRTYLLEINARQPASTSLESKLQGENTVFESHIKALLGLSISSGPEIRGAQIVKRVTNSRYDIDVPALADKGLDLVEYENTEHNKEILRIQSDRGIMSAHRRLNDLGEFISSCIRRI